MSQLSFRTDAMLYQTDFGFDAIPRVLDTVLGREMDEVRVRILLSAKPLDGIMQNAAESLDLLVSASTRRKNGAWSAQLESRHGRGKGRLVSGRVLLLPHPRLPSVWALISDARSEFFDKTFRDLIRRTNPRPVAPILRTPQMADVLRLVSESPAIVSTRVTQLGFRGYITSKGATRTIERDRKWTDLSVTEAFSDALEAGSWVTDARIHYETTSGVQASLAISRYGVVSFRNAAGPAAPHVLDRVAVLADEWYRFLSGRQRDRATHFTSRPFVVTYSVPIADGAEQLGLLRQALSTIPNVSCTQLHGNPYLHAVLTDYEDGSTYEVLVLSPREITVIPQGRSTVRALQRLCSQLFSEFREGELRELADA